MIEEKKTLKIIVHGNVQGVCFRSTAAKHAERCGIVGTVENLVDGTVEIVAHGAEPQLEEFLRLLEEKPGMGSISQIEKKEAASSSSFHSFHIL